MRSWHSRHFATFRIGDFRVFTCRLHARAVTVPRFCTAFLSLVRMDVVYLCGLAVLVAVTLALIVGCAALERRP